MPIVAHVLEYPYNLYLWSYFVSNTLLDQHLEQKVMFEKDINLLRSSTAYVGDDVAYFFPEFRFRGCEKGEANLKYLVIDKFLALIIISQCHCHK